MMRNAGLVEVDGVTGKARSLQRVDREVGQ